MMRRIFPLYSGIQLCYMPAYMIWIAYSVSNLVAIGLLLLSWKKPAWGRLLFFLLFGWAAWFNTTMALSTPAIYTGYAQYAFLPVYRHFINGYFAQHTAPFVVAIAIGQACIAFGMVAKGRLFRLGAIGAMLFLLGIAPLGVGSAFPATLVMAWAMLMLYQNGSEQWLWWLFWERD